MTVYKASFNNSGNSYTIDQITTSTTMGGSYDTKLSYKIQGGDISIVKKALVDKVNSEGRSTNKIAESLGIDKAAFFNYLIANHDSDKNKKLSAEEIASGILALDKANGLDGKLDLKKLEAVKHTDNKHKGGDDDKHKAGDGGDSHASSGSGSTAKSGKGTGSSKAPAAPAKDVKTVPEVSDKSEDQNGVKAKLKDSGLKDWTAVAEAREKAKTSNKNGVVDSADEVATMFGITKAAATALFKKAEQLVTDKKAVNVTDGIGVILREMDLISGGKGDGKITVREFNTYVKDLLASDAEKAKEEKDAKTKAPKTPPAKTPPAEEKTDPPATDNTETVEAEEDTAKPSFFSKIRLPLAIGLLAGSALLLVNEQKKRQFAMRQQQQHMGFAGQQQQQQSIGFGPIPQQPPFGPFMPQGRVPGPSNQNMFNGLLA